MDNYEPPTKEQIQEQDHEFDRIVGNPKTLKKGDFVKIEGKVFEISAIFPETKSGKRTIKLKEPFFEKKPSHSFEPFQHPNQDKCRRTPTWIKTGRHG
ncbi:hypothetical protein DSECCO2_414020 [anaerobic digester metagenome]